MHINKNQGTAYSRYFQALGILAKNDIFGQLEHTIVVGFYEALREAMTAYGDWDGDKMTFEEAAGNLIGGVLT